MSILELKDVHVSYGSIEALHGISMRVDEGEIVTLIGANGAGKSTTMMAVSGLVHVTSGEIHFRGERIDRLPPHRIVERGICQVPEGRHIFPRLTVDENLQMGSFTRRDREQIASDRRLVEEMFPVLAERRTQPGGTLSGGEQQMLAIARALMARPRLLVLDEPSLGLAPLLVKRIFETVKEINRRGTTILLVEQNAHLALETARRGYCMETGAIVLEDTCAALLANDMVKKSYLGE